MRTQELLQSRQQYFNLIKEALSEKRKKVHGDKYEKHHILPKSLFPLWRYNKRNIVLLTKKEHIQAHIYLYKIYKCSEMALAVHYLKEYENFSDEELKDIQKKRVEKSKNNYYDMTGYHHTDECKKRISEHMKGKQNFLGVHHSDETKKKISEHSWMKTDEAKKQCSERSKGRTWWTDGENQKFCKECPGNGWYKGRPLKTIEKHRQIMEEKHNWKPKIK